MEPHLSVFNGLEELEAGQIETVAKPFRADPPKPIREAPEEFRRILEDTQRGRGTGLFGGGSK